jgi:hypothetical protein
MIVTLPTNPKWSVIYISDVAQVRTIHDLFSDLENHLPWQRLLHYGIFAIDMMSLAVFYTRYSLEVGSMQTAESKN